MHFFIKHCFITVIYKVNVGIVPETNHEYQITGDCIVEMAQARINAKRENENGSRFKNLAKKL